MVRGLITSLLSLFLAMGQGPILSGIMNVQPAAAGGNAAYVQEAEYQNDGTITSMTATFTNNVGAGHTVVCQMAWNVTTSTISTFRDGNSSNFTLLDGPTADGTQSEVATYYLLSSTGGTKTVTVTFSVSIGFGALNCQEASGVTALDVHNLSGAKTGATWTGATVTSTGKDYCFVAGYDGAGGNGLTWTAGTNYAWTLVSPATGNPINGDNFSGDEYLIQGAAGNVAAQITYSTGVSHGRISLACFKP
jgi:hypothetical protein